jgi:hypothetical protein
MRLLPVFVAIFSVFDLGGGGVSFGESGSGSGSLFLGMREDLLEV